MSSTGRNRTFENAANQPRNEVMDLPCIPGLRNQIRQRVIERQDFDLAVDGHWTSIERMRGGGDDYDDDDD